MDEIKVTVTTFRVANSLNNFKNSVKSTFNNVLPTNNNNNNNNIHNEDEEIILAQTALQNILKQIKDYHKLIYNEVIKYCTPIRMWAFFTICCLLNYIDRGAIAGSMPQIQIDFGLNDTEAGIVGASFMLGYMLMAPLFGHWSQFVRPQILMCVGLTVWIFASFLTGISVGFKTLVLARTISGVGEASFAGLAPTYIDDIAPPKHRSLLLALFFAQITIGVAVGYAIGGLFTEYISWRVPFFLDVLIMVPFALLCPFIPNPHEMLVRCGLEPKESKGEDQLDDFDNPNYIPPTFLQSIYYLISNLRYVLIVLAYGCVVFVVGSLYFWAPTFVVDVLGMDLAVANLSIGVVAVFTGLIGTSFGGFLVDHLGGSDSVATLICLIFSMIIFPISVTSFSLYNKYLFFILVTIGELLIFGITSPINILCLSVVEKNMRSFSMTMQILFIHLVGDFPSPFVIGWVADRTNIRTAMIFCCLWIAFAIFFFFLAWIVVRAHEKNKLMRELQNAGHIEGEIELDFTTRK